MIRIHTRMNEKKPIQFPILRGFTLLEVMLAVTIFSLVISAILMTFRTGMRAYETSTSHMEVMQQARVIFTRLGKDLRSAHFQDESSYNTTLRYHIDTHLKDREEDEEEGEWEADDDFENPYNYCLEIDLKFEGENKEGGDSLNFVTRRPIETTRKMFPFGMERVHYYVEDESLMRSVSPILTPPKNTRGDPIETPIIRADRIAARVKQFDLRYGFFYNEEWLEAEDWNSNENVHRNPPFAFDESDLDSDDYYQYERRKPDDHLPAYVKVHLELGDKQNAAKTFSYDTELRLYRSQENYLPSIEYEYDRDR